MINCVVHVQTEDRQSRFNWVDKRRINGLLEAINEREHCDHTWVDKRRINGLCLLDRSFGKCGLFLSQSWAVSRYRYMRYSVFRYLASANGGRSAVGGKCGAVCLVPPLDSSVALGWWRR